MPKVNFAGLELRNPVIAASATPTISAKHWKKAAEGGAGAVVTKSVVFPDKNGRPAGQYPRPRFMLMNKSEGYDASITERHGFFSLFRIGEPYPTPEEMERELDIAKKPGYMDIPIIVSVCGPPGDYEAWAKLAKRMEDAGADALELNMHCIPVIKYTDPLIVKAVKDAVKLPVITKLMAINDPPEEYGPKVQLAGTDAITGLGTFGFSCTEIDIESKRAYLGTIHGAGGSWLRAISLAYIAKMAKKVTVPLSGVTGVLTGEDAVKYMLVGATTVQVCGAIYARGYKVLGEIAKGIDEYMQRNGYKTIEDFRGAALSSLGTPAYDPPVRAKVCEETCAGCGECLDVCLFDAITMQNGKANIDPKTCDGCGVCWSVCPQKAINMAEI